MARNPVSIGYLTIRFHFPNEMYPFVKYQMSSLAIGFKHLQDLLSGIGCL